VVHVEDMVAEHLIPVEDHVNGIHVPAVEDRLVQLGHLLVPVAADHMNDAEALPIVESRGHEVLD